MQKQVHATRTAPLCKDCKHYVMGRRPDMALCGHPGTPISLTDGSPVMSTNCMRGDGGAAFRLLNVTPCGSTGNLFEPVSDSIDKLVPGIVGQVALVDGGAGSKESAEQSGVLPGVALTELVIDRCLGDLKPITNDGGCVDFQRIHEPLPLGDESGNGSASSTGQEATPCE